ncbi:hypothetical protein F7Q99_19940 [Streptomyces kaniharaensis]|uniref:Uncharacterized protein n=1 Tax=Streptomyces kaniharaensis TaxID=212423 RepID=A0A6N7KS62_9ACTN|nr:hypothetical protein [Streptomyces kaniharaensis]MQS14472.1 hypothetical protein [Streptomyces kaniharaensis]
MITIRYELVDPEEIEGADIDVTEDRGSLLLKISRALTPEQIVSALNEASRAILSGGHWFQEWKGDIISVDPREVRGADDPSTIPTERSSLYDVNKPQSGAA